MAPIFETQANFQLLGRCGRLLWTGGASVLSSVAGALRSEWVYGVGHVPSLKTRPGTCLVTEDIQESPPLQVVFASGERLWASDLWPGSLPYLFCTPERHLAHLFTSIWDKEEKGTAIKRLCCLNCGTGKLFWASETDQGIAATKLSRQWFLLISCAFQFKPNWVMSWLLQSCPDT